MDLIRFLRLQFGHVDANSERQKNQKHQCIYWHERQVLGELLAPNLWFSEHNWHLPCIYERQVLGSKRQFTLHPAVEKVQLQVLEIMITASLQGIKHYYIAINCWNIWPKQCDVLSIGLQYIGPLFHIGKSMWCGGNAREV
jgi:hypothetical protein